MTMATATTATTTSKMRLNSKRESPLARSETNSSEIKKSKSNIDDAALAVSMNLDASFSRLKLLEDHDILRHMMLFLDETGLFQLENSYSNAIKKSSFALTWEYLSRNDASNKTYAHRRWRPLMSDNDVEISGDLQCCCQSGRNFAKEALFVQKREKEASSIYDFDQNPSNTNEIPRRSNTITSLLSSYCLLLKEQEKKHWNEWFDYRKNDVNGKHAFVRLSLRDGSGRFWHGFRLLRTTNHNRTFFRLQFDLKELIQDMAWTELDSYLKRKDNRLKAMESLMKKTQLTISINQKLLISTGGYCGNTTTAAGNDRFYFHSRNYRYPLSGTTKNDLQWNPYRVCMVENLARNELVIELDCDHTDLPFMRAEDIGNPNAHMHW